MDGDETRNEEKQQINVCPSSAANGMDADDAYSSRVLHDVASRVEYCKYAWHDDGTGMAEMEIESDDFFLFAFASSLSSRCRA